MTKAVLVDGVGHYQEWTMPQDVMTIRVPVRRPMSVTFAADVPVTKLAADIADFEWLGKLPDERMVFGQRGLGFCLWTVRADFTGQLDERAIQAIAKEISDQIAHLTHLAPIVRLYDITTPIANGDWQREVWGVGRQGR